MTKGVVYTCLFGWKEELIFKPLKDSDADFVVFSDKKIDVPPGCRLIILEDTGIGPERLSRRPKILPHRYFGEYEWSLYVDNRAQLKMLPEKIYQKYMAGTQHSIVCFKHPDRKCAYHEAEVIIALDYDKEARIREQLDTYRMNGFPRNFGLIAGTVLLRNHHDHRLIRHHEDWYEHVMRFSKRDQLSFDYLRWFHKIPIASFYGSLNDNELINWLKIKRLSPSFDPQNFALESGNGSMTESEVRERAWKTSDSKRIPKRHRWQLERIFNKFRLKRGSFYQEAHGFCFAYETALNSLKEERFTLLEIGLQKGRSLTPREKGGLLEVPSLPAWAEYFRKAVIHGTDTAPLAIINKHDRISIHQNTFETEADFDALIKDIGDRPKVIVISSENSSEKREKLLCYALKFAAPGGYVFIENLHNTLEIEQNEETFDLSSSDIIKTAQEYADRISFFDSRETYTGTLRPDALAQIRIKSSKNYGLTPPIVPKLKRA